MEYTVINDFINIYTFSCYEERVYINMNLHKVVELMHNLYSMVNIMPDT